MTRDETILKAFDSGCSIRECGRKAGTTFDTAKKVLKRAGKLGSNSPRGETPRPDDASVLKALRDKPHTLAEVAKRLGCGDAEAKVWLDAKANEGHNIRDYSGFFSVERVLAPSSTFDTPIIEVISDADDTFTLGALGDSHLCSKYERLDVLYDLYDQYEREGVRTVLHTGNWIDGEAKFNKHDLKVHGLDAQLRYLAAHYPKRNGIDTYAIAGDDHEGWYAQRAGIEIGRYAETQMQKAGRTDWHDLGYMEAFVRLKNANSGQSTMLHVVHPGGGSAYATSYTVQKICESYSSGEKPAVMFAGHYHKMELINIRGVWVVQTGTQQDQTPFMRKKRLEAHVGGHVVRLRQDRKTGAIVEMNGMKRYFNVGFYNNRWSHGGDVNLPPRVMGGAA